ncbi:replication initiator protein A [Bacillus velezensis]|uniref:replication initiator protein A n=1 Tax=Bacillus velezensis TaxID=492670 RepID=UPI001A90F2C8|nr:replication initiator protein A [Bacillus velezensis]BCT30334.1 hypothetical protein BVAD3_40080 [Bacillus velezensis]
MPKRINIKDVINEEFYQLPKVFFWNKTYREGLSHGAKLLYMLVRDRFKLSMYTTKEAIEAGSESPAYVDEDGDIYCILDNGEIEFTLNCTAKTVIKFMDELIEHNLVSRESVDGGANRIYLNKLDSSGITLAQFLGEKDYHKHVSARKKKGKKPIKTLEECIAAQEERMRQRTTKMEGWKNSTPRDENNTPPGGGKNTPLGDGKTPSLGGNDIPPLGVEKIHPNNIYSNDLDSIPTNSYENNEINVNKSSSESNKTEQIEEERKKNITVDDNYSGLETILSELNFNVDTKGINVIKKTLMESKIESFLVTDVVNAVGSHAKNVKSYESKGESIKYIPAFFANNLVDRIRENEAKRKSKQQQNQVNDYAAYEPRVKLYNFLEN